MPTNLRNRQGLRIWEDRHMLGTSEKAFWRRHGTGVTLKDKKPVAPLRLGKPG